MPATRRSRPLRQLVLRNFQSPGDIVMLTAAVRDLHLCYPGQMLTDVRTPCPGLWENNPYITPLAEDAPYVEVLQCEYPLINFSNSAPYHFVHGFIEFINERLGLNARPTLFRGDIHLSEPELAAEPPLKDRIGAETPYWLLVSGGKRDFTIKWWDPARYQKVVDQFRGRITFVQVGDTGHHHPPLSGVVDLRGKTTLRDLVMLVHHAQGVLSPVSLLMHLAAAVPMRQGGPSSRPCVVIAGGREPPHWCAYPQHQFIHTVGALPCCVNGGCWRSRTLPLGDGDEKDSPSALCVDVRGTLPRCMDLITAEEVIRRIELYEHGGAIHYAAGNHGAAARGVADLKG